MCVCVCVCGYYDEWIVDNEYTVEQFLIVQMNAFI